MQTFWPLQARIALEQRSFIGETVIVPLLREGQQSCNVFSGKIPHMAEVVSGQDASCHCAGYDREQKGCNKESCPRPPQPGTEPRPPTIVQPFYQPIIVPGAVRPPAGPGASCQWSEWCGWTDYGYGVTRRSR